MGRKTEDLFLIAGEDGGGFMVPAERVGSFKRFMKDMKHAVEIPGSIWGPAGFRRLKKTDSGERKEIRDWLSRDRDEKVVEPVRILDCLIDYDAGVTVAWIRARKGVKSLGSIGYVLTPNVGRVESYRVCPDLDEEDDDG